MQSWQLPKQLSKFPQSFLPLLLLTTAIALPSCVTSQPPKPFSTEALPTEAIAEISEIRNYPVKVRYINTAAYRPATVGIPLKVNESVATEVNSSAQVNLRNGAIFRIGGIANLTIRPQNQVEVSAGTLVAWADGERKASTQIQAPFGEVSSNEGTVYIEIPAKAAAETIVIALDGKATVLLKASARVINLNAGEEIRIKANGTATEPKRIEKETVDKRIASNNLLFGFSNQLASAPKIATEFGVQNVVKEASKVEFRRDNLPSRPSGRAAANSSPVSNVEPPRAETRSSESDRRDAPAPEPVRQPEPPAAANPSPAPSAPATATPLPPVEAPPAPSPAPIAPPVAPPVAPPAQPAPIDLPPAPVQPEVPAPVRKP